MRTEGIPAEFSLTKAPKCVLLAKRHNWSGSVKIGDGAYMRQCAYCGVRQGEFWGGKSASGAAGGKCRTRFAPAPAEVRS